MELVSCNCWWLKFQTEVGLKYLILVERIDSNVASAAGAEIVVNLPAVGPGCFERDGIAQHVGRGKRDTFQANAAVEDVRINQVRIEGVLFGVLPPRAQFPIMFRFQLTNGEADLVSRIFITMSAGYDTKRTGGGSGSCALIAFEVHGEIAKQSHRQLADFPADFPRHVVNQEAIDALLIFRE